jgi:putative transposase
VRVGLQVSARRACHVIPVPRSTDRYRRVAHEHTPLRMRRRDVAAARVRYGYRRWHVLRRREGWQVNHKRLYRLYRREGLALRLKRRRKRPSHLRGVTPIAQAPNEPWSRDVVADSLAEGRRFRALTVVDHMTRESPALEVEGSLRGQRVVTVLERRACTHGLPTVLWVDNGPECTSKAIDEWAHRRGVQLAFSRPGTPTDHPCIEAFNARFREECLHQPWFISIEEARTAIEAWRVEYTTERPHTALHNEAPAVYKVTWLRNHGVQTASD